MQSLLTLAALLAYAIAALVRPQKNLRPAQLAAEVNDLHTPPAYTDMVEGTVLFENGSSVRQHMARSSTTS